MVQDVDPPEGPQFRVEGGGVQRLLPDGSWVSVIKPHDLRGAPVEAEAATPKPWWQSRTIVGAAIAGGSILGGLGFGFSLDAETQKVVADQLVAFLVAGGALFGTVMTIWGRFKASRPVTLTKPKP